MIEWQSMLYLFVGKNSCPSIRKFVRDDEQSKSDGKNEGKAGEGEHCANAWFGSHFSKRGMLVLDFFANTL